MRHRRTEKDSGTNLRAFGIAKVVVALVILEVHALTFAQPSTESVLSYMGVPRGLDGDNLSVGSTLHLRAQAANSRVSGSLLCSRRAGILNEDLKEPS